MAIPFYVEGRGDLDSLFEAYSSGSQYGTTGYVLAGYGDLGYRYQLKGGATAIANTGYKVGSSDFAALFLGKTAGATISLNSTYAVSQIGSGVQASKFRLTSTGNVEKTVGGVDTVQHAYVSGGSASSFSAYAHKDSGDALSSSDALDTWLNLGTSRTWQLSATIASQYKECQLTIQIRRDSDSAIMDTTIVTIDVERTT